MTDLSIKMGKIHLKNPLICASSEITMTQDGIRAAIDAGAAAVIAKSVNELPAAAAQLAKADYVLLDDDFRPIPWTSPQRLNASLFCRSGLAQTPIDEYLPMLADLDRYAQTKQSYVVGSITVAAAEPAAEIAARMQQAGLRWIELNLGAPHGRESGAVSQITARNAVRDYVRAVRRAVSVALAVKLTAQADDPLSLAATAIEEGADMIVLAGRVQGFMPDIETQQPILGSWGAIGGHWALPAMKRLSLCRSGGLGLSCAGDAVPAGFGVGVIAGFGSSRFSGAIFSSSLSGASGEGTSFLSTIA